jgi:histidinol phosphatase-like enzyme
MLLEVDKSWTLFLDRDGVINEKRDNDYVKNWNITWNVEQYKKDLPEIEEMIKQKK